jgi:hypothetical protein
MEQRGQSGHIGEKELVQLVLDELPFAREEEVLGHIADCDACAELSRRLGEVSELVDGMASAGAIVHRIAAAVRSVMNWGPRIAGLAEDLAVVLGGVVAMPSFGGGGLEFANPPGGAGGLPPILDTVRIRGAVGYRGAASGPSRPAGPTRTRGQLRAQAAPDATVEFEDSPAGLEIRLTSWPEGQAPPALAVVPRVGAPIRAELAKLRGSRGVLGATIRKPEGDFVLVLFGGSVPRAR